MGIAPAFSAKQSRSLLPGIAWVLVSLALFSVIPLLSVIGHKSPPVTGSIPTPLARPKFDVFQFSLAVGYMVCIVAAAIAGIRSMYRAEVSERWKAVALVPSVMLLTIYLLMLSCMFI